MDVDKELFPDVTKLSGDPEGAFDDLELLDDFELFEDLEEVLLADEVFFFEDDNFLFMPNLDLLLEEPGLFDDFDLLLPEDELLADPEPFVLLFELGLPFPPFLLPISIAFASVISSSHISSPEQKKGLI